MAAELLRHPLVPWLATYLAHSTILCTAAWGFDLWASATSARERTLGLSRERMWKLALFLPLLTTLVQCAGGFSFWQLAADAPLAPQTVRTVLPGLLPIPITSAGPVQPLHAASGFQLSWALLASALWLVGVGFGALVWMREWHALGRAVRGMRPNTDPELAQEFDELRTGELALTGTRLYIGRNVLVPLTLGWTRMRVVVPERAARELDPDERRAMLGHELAHARRRDPLWISAARAVESLFFFQPLNRLARIKLQDEAEFQADRWAIERGVCALSLASCLTEVAGWIVSQRRALPVPSMAARGARLTRRVERLLEERRAPLPLRSAPWSLAFFALALGTAAAAVPGRAEQTFAASQPLARQPEAFELVAEASSDDLVSQFDSLATQLDDLADEAEERELDPRWHARLEALRVRLASLQSSYARVQELADEAACTPPQPATIP
ncbi:MAG: M56 family metallopeptidase [Planctomycetes bacterium]|nr:M56 family metallopeptidase [Planctomycetota bacterium]